MTIANYRRGIRGAVRGLWSGVIDKEQFMNAMDGTIFRGITDAWRTGAKECGITPDEFTPEEKTGLATFVVQQQSYVDDFADAVIAKSKANKGKVGPLFTRSEMWINRWNEAKTKANAMACVNSKKQWILGPTEHCVSCKGFAGRVYRNSVWLKNNALPQGRNLACKGYRCQCRLVDTDKPITGGKFPSRLLSEANYAETNRTLHPAKSEVRGGVKQPAPADYEGLTKSD